MDLNKLKLMLGAIFALTWVTGPSWAQQGTCKVLVPALDGTYTGGCKHGLANGKGTAKGMDSYTGHFFKGKPDGSGTYTWADSSYYVGQWLDGMRDGEGRMVYPDSVVSGFWRENKYLGKKNIPPFKIIQNLSVTRYTFTKSKSVGNGVRIRIMQDGMDNTTIENFSMVYDNGNEYQMGNFYGVQNTHPPLDVKIKYRTWNQFHSAQYDVTFEFTINDPGTWDVLLVN